MKIPRGYHDAYLRCRRLGHAWDEFTPSVVPWSEHDMRGLFCEAARCTSCGCIRWRQISRATGAVYKVGYDYPDGYNFSLEERPSKNDFRLLAHNRQMRKRRTKKSRS